MPESVDDPGLAELVGAGAASVEKMGTVALGVALLEGAAVGRLGGLVPGDERSEGAGWLGRPTARGATPVGAGRTVEGGVAAVGVALGTVMGAADGVGRGFGRGVTITGTSGSTGPWARGVAVGLAVGKRKSLGDDCAIAGWPPTDKAAVTAIAAATPPEPRIVAFDPCPITGACRLSR